MIPSNERSAFTSLWLLAEAEERFRQDDRDGNGVRDYWTLDVRGLFTLLGPTGQPGQTALVALIPVDLAAADATQSRSFADRPWPYNGYFFNALDLDEQGAPYAQRTTPDGDASRSMTKFAFCAFPADYGRTGVWTYVINEKHELFRVDTGGAPVRRWGEPHPEAWTPK